MRLLALLLLALSLAASAAAQGNETNETPSANETAEPAAPAGPLELVLETHTAGSGGYFTVAGDSARNPTIRAAPGQEVRVTLRATDGGFHNFCVAADQCTEYVTAAGQEATLTFTAPESGTIEYYCLPHRSAGMLGTLAIGDGAAAPDGDAGAGGEGGAITGDTIDLGQYDPACAGKVAPAAVAEGVVGAPTLQDYIDACSPQEGPVVVQQSGADYVIPISWALLGVGVLGVVWVHKYYKP